MVVDSGQQLLQILINVTIGKANDISGKLILSAVSNNVNEPS
jgi:hypothetical protein